MFYRKISLINRYGMLAIDSRLFLLFRTVFCKNLYSEKSHLCDSRKFTGKCRKPINEKHNEH
jgi:hypothetical protein